MPPIEASPNWTEGLFVIDEIKYTNPITYIIKDLNNEEIKGSFYEPELLKAQQEVFRIDKVIRRDYKKKQALVKRKGYDDDFNTWIPIKDLISILKIKYSIQLWRIMSRQKEEVKSNITLKKKEKQPEQDQKWNACWTNHGIVNHATKHIVLPASGHICTPKSTKKPIQFFFGKRFKEKNVSIVWWKILSHLIIWISQILKNELKLN